MLNISILLNCYIFVDAKGILGSHILMAHYVFTFKALEIFVMVMVLCLLNCHSSLYSLGDWIIPALEMINISIPISEPYTIIMSELSF